MVLDRKLAPFYRGEDDEGGDREECPICMLVCCRPTPCVHCLCARGGGQPFDRRRCQASRVPPRAQYYPGGLNRSNCCGQGICSTCFLQVSPRANKSANCPFCKATSYTTIFRGPMASAERERLQAEEQRVIEMQIETRNREEKAYLERMQERGVTPPTSLGASSSAMPVPGAASASRGSGSHPNSLGASLGASLGPSPSASPYGSFSASASPRLAPPVQDTADEQQLRWLEAQQSLTEAVRAKTSARRPCLLSLHRMAARHTPASPCARSRAHESRHTCQALHASRHPPPAPHHAPPTVPLSWPPTLTLAGSARLDVRLSDATADERH